MNTIDGQLILPLRAVELVDDTVLARQGTLQKAIVTCADLGGLEDKQAADALGVDPATWSRIKSGQANFPIQNYKAYAQRCGNWLVLQWLARDAGFGLHQLETETQRQLRIERERADELSRENALLKNLLQGKAA